MAGTAKHEPITSHVTKILTGSNLIDKTLLNTHLPRKQEGDTAHCTGNHRISSRISSAASVSPTHPRGKGKPRGVYQSPNWQQNHSRELTNSVSAGHPRLTHHSHDSRQTPRHGGNSKAPYYRSPGGPPWPSNYPRESARLTMNANKTWSHIIRVSWAGWEISLDCLLTHHRQTQFINCCIQCLNQCQCSWHQTTTVVTGSACYYVITYVCFSTFCNLVFCIVLCNLVVLCCYWNNKLTYLLTN